MSSLPLLLDQMEMYTSMQNLVTLDRQTTAIPFPPPPSKTVRFSVADPVIVPASTTASCTGRALWVTSGQQRWPSSKGSIGDLGLKTEPHSVPKVENPGRSSRSIKMSAFASTALQDLSRFCLLLLVSIACGCGRDRR